MASYLNMIQVTGRFYAGFTWHTNFVSRGDSSVNHYSKGCPLNLWLILLKFAMKDTYLEISTGLQVYVFFGE